MRTRLTAVVFFAVALAGLGAAIGVSRVASDASAAAAAPSDQALVLIGEAQAALKLTTISYPAWLGRNYTPAQRAATQWAIAFRKLDEAKALLAPPPTTTTTAPTTTAPPTNTTPDSIPPSVPANQTITAITQTGFTMNWSASTDNVAVTGYRVFRNGAQLAQTTATVRSYAYTGLVCNTTYTVGLTAVDAAGNQSNVAFASGLVTTASCTTPPPTTTTPPPTTTTPPPTTTTPPSSGSIAPGQSWQTAYNAAAAGSTLTVLAGNHGEPTLTGTKTIRFLGEAGAVVGRLPDNAANVTYENIDINTGTETWWRSGGFPSAANITWRNVDVTGDYPAIEVDADHFSWIGGSITGPKARTCAAGEPVVINGDFGLIDGVNWGPGKAGICSDGGNFHLEDLRIQGANDFTIRNSTFSANSDAGSGHIFITTTSPSDSQARRLKIENTIFPPVIGTYAIQAHTNVTSYDHYVIRGNRFDQPLLMDSPFVALVACGNTGSVPTSWKSSC